MSNIHFSRLDNIKMTCQTTYVLKFLSNLISGKDIFTLTLVYLEYETSIYIWEFEMMIVLK